jgi:manganese oxidase
MNNNAHQSIESKGPAYIWESHIMAPDMSIAHYKTSYKVRSFCLRAEPIEHPILSEVTLDALGYNGKTPGPAIVIVQGEWLFLTLENHLDEATGIMIQGYAKAGALKNISDFEQYGPSIEPGDSYTYKLLCDKPGTFLYRSSHDFQSSLGLTGALIVLPAEENIDPDNIPDKDFIILMQQWEISELPLGNILPGKYKPNKYRRNPNFFTLNGKCYPNTAPFYFNKGDKIRMRFISKVGEVGWIHLEGHPFEVITINGFSRYHQMNDTIEFSSGYRSEIELTANNPGNWLLNATAVFQQSNNGIFPGGITSNIIYLKV